jgi:photosystem II stability/assembly factor-like uncharacterized protein
MSYPKNQFNPIMTLFFVFLVTLISSVKLSAQEAFWEPVDGPYGLYLSSLVETHGGDLLAGGSIGIFRSTDHGVSWSRGSLSVYVDAIFTTKKNSILLIGKDGASLKSIDGGKTWKAFKGEGIVPLCCDSAGNIYAINSGMNGFIWRSTDDGENWQRVDTKSPNQAFRSLVIDAEGNIYGAGLKCIVKSTDNGITWKILSNKSFGKKGPDILNLTISKDGTLWASDAHGLFKSTSAGHRWEKTNNNLPDGLMYQLIFAKSGSIFIRGYFYKGAYHAVLKSNDNGKSWVEVFRAEQAIGISTMLLDPNGYLFVTGSVIYRSTDEGSTWSKYCRGLTNDGMRSMSISSKGTIYAGTFSNFSKSTDKGVSWIQIDSGLTAHYRCFTDILPFSDSILFVGNGHDGLFVSTDAGNSWQNTGIRGTIQSMIKDRKSKIYVAASSGSYISVDTGKTWQSFGFELGWIRKLSINSDGIILAGNSDAYSRELFEVYRSNEDTLDWLHVNPDSSNHVEVIPSSGSILFIDGAGLEYLGLKVIRLNRQVLIVS